MTMLCMDMPHVTASDIRPETARSPVLYQGFLRTRGGFQRHEDNEQLKPYIQQKDELSIHDGCLMWGIRVIVPSRFRPVLLDEQHNAHSGIVRMKAVCRSLMWWPGIDLDIERTVNSCDTCRRSRPKSAEAPFFFFRVLHKHFPRLRAHAIARYVTVARSSAVQASSSRRQDRRWVIACGSPQSQSTD